jgi:hypothetical protein
VSFVRTAIAPDDFPMTFGKTVTVNGGLTP